MPATMKYLQHSLCSANGITLGLANPSIYSFFSMVLSIPFSSNQPFILLLIFNAALH